MDEEQAGQMIESSGNDIRQVINLLQMWNQQRGPNATEKDDKNFVEKTKKDAKVMMTNYDAAWKLLNSGEGGLNTKYPSFNDKLDLFFIDYDWVPMLI